jgi:hypothetical protein
VKVNKSARESMKKKWEDEKGRKQILYAKRNNYDDEN